jgi:hypothetical protein
VVSSVPPTNYAAWDGTSFAAPYVTGLAALLLAHHPDFRGRFANRDAARVDRLFELIRGSCRPLSFGDPGRSGSGLPDAVVALGLAAPVGMTPPADPALANLWLVMAHAGLITSTLPTAPVPAPGSAPSSAPAPTSLTPGPGDAIAPLRAAMRAAGLLGHEAPAPDET